jgi:hypothetical protein
VYLAKAAGDIGFDQAEAFFQFAGRALFPPRIRSQVIASQQEPPKETHLSRKTSQLFGKGCRPGHVSTVLVDLVAGRFNQQGSLSSIAWRRQANRTCRWS